ncbi:MAG: DUF2357 domain-containing protein [Candidatus Sedimenticola sp. (ex Thyasira tokunagai)]
MELEVFSSRKGELTRVGCLSPGSTLGDLEENRQYLIRVNTEGSRLFVDDAPIDMDPHRQYWLWSPGFYAGEVVVELELPGHHEPIRYLVDVAPASNKSGREQYSEYISQIADYAPHLLMGTEPARHALGGRSHVSLSSWIRYARLRCFIDPYLGALRAICDRPLVRNRYQREQVPVHLARRVDVNTVRRLEANPKLLTAMAGQQVVHGDLSLGDNRLDVPFNEPTLDHPANRLIALQLDGVLRLTSQLINEFSQYRTASSETETDVQARMPRRIEYLTQIKKQLLKLSRLSPFNAVSRSKPGVAGINAVSGSPHYDRSHRLGIRLLREGVSQLASDEQHYLAPTWQVYEAWCFVTLAQQLKQQLPEYQWDLKTVVVSADMILEGEKEGTRIRLYTQLACPSLENPNRYGYYSITRKRIPDLVLEYSNVDCTKFICLDSKYTTSRSGILDSMASAHIYRDSIKQNGAAPLYSVLLVPGNPDATLLSSENYVDRHSVGCIPIADDGDATRAMKRLLEYFSTPIHHG